MTKLTHIQEQPTEKDLCKFQVIPDKIDAKSHGESHRFVSFVSLKNKSDVKVAKKLINEIAQKVLGYQYPIVSRRYYQNSVIYQIYVSKYYVILNGKIEDTYDLLQRGINIDETDDNPKWREFKAQVNKALGLNYL